MWVNSLPVSSLTTGVKTSGQLAGKAIYGLSGPQKAEELLCHRRRVSCFSLTRD